MRGSKEIWFSVLSYFYELMSAKGAKFDPKVSCPRVILVPMFARPVPELKFSLSGQPSLIPTAQILRKSLIPTAWKYSFMLFLMISAFGNSCADMEQLLGLNVIFGFLHQAFGLNVHFLLILRVRLINALTDQIYQGK